MKPTEALEFARGAARFRQLRFAKPHAVERMQERGATQEDVSEAILTAKQVTASKQHRNRWQLTGGCDLDGEPLDVVFAVDGNVVTVVTLFGE